MGSLPCLVDWRWHYAYDHYLYHHYSDYHDDYGDRRRQHAALLQTWQPPLGHQDSGEIEDVQKRNFIRPTSDRCLALSVVESLNALVEIFNISYQSITSVAPASGSHSARESNGGVRKGLLLEEHGEVGHHHHHHRHKSLNDLQS